MGKQMNDQWKSFYSWEIGEAMFLPISQAVTRREVERILKTAKPRPGARILDLGCGIGRHCLEFAKHGFEVVGLDYSKAYLDQANDAKQRKKLSNVQFVRGDMRKITSYFPPESFALVVCLRNTFGGSGDRNDDRRVLAQAARILEPRGALVLNISNESGVRYHWGAEAVKFGHADLLYWREYKNGSFYLERFVYKPQVRRTFMECITIETRAGRVKRFSLRKNTYSHEWFVTTLRSFGLEIESKWERLGTERKFHKSGWQQSFVARKR